jgi:hypothetical protein
MPRCKHSGAFLIPSKHASAAAGDARRLQRRGAYAGKTLREHCGLAWPNSAFVAATLQEP